VTRVGVAAVLVPLLAGCVLADPAPTLPLVQPTAPIVVSRAPAAQVIVGPWPKQFIIYVTVSDPSEALEWLAFVDFIPGVTTASSNPEGIPGPVPASPDGGTIGIVVTGISPPLLGSGCHTFEVVIAPGFSGITPVNQSQAVSQTWVYTESGNPGACGGYDAGAAADGTFPDASGGG